MKTIIAGSRSINAPAVIDEVVADSGFKITEVVSGCARGVDEAGEDWAFDRDIPVRKFPADWELGRGAGMIRNAQMAAYADALIAIWDGKSPGTKGMIEIANKKGLKVFVSVRTP